MKEIKVECGKWTIERNTNGYYDCKYYEYYKSINDYRLICTDENCTKEYVEQTFDFVIDF